MSYKPYEFSVRYRKAYVFQSGSFKGSAFSVIIIYLIKYERDVESGAKISNYVDKFPDTIALTLYAAVMDPCSDKYRAAYIVIPSFQPSPAVTISLNAESTETEFSGNINVSYCSADKILYYIYFPDEEAVTTVVSAA